MAITNGYATLAEFKDWLLQGGTFVAAHDAILENHVTVASRAIETVCGNRQFWQDASATVMTYRIRKDGERSGVVNGCEAWVKDISTTTGLVVKVDTGLDFGWAETWTLNTDFVLEPLRQADPNAVAWHQIVAVGSKRFVFDRYRATLQVTAKHGFSAVPQGIKEACLALAGKLEFARRAPGGIASFGEFGPVRMAREDPTVMGLLGPFMLAGT